MTIMTFPTSDILSDSHCTYYQFGPVAGPDFEAVEAVYLGPLEDHVDVGVAEGAPARLGGDGVAPVCGQGLQRLKVLKQTTVKPA